MTKDKYKLFEKNIWSNFKKKRLIFFKYYFLVFLVLSIFPEVFDNFKNLKSIYDLVSFAVLSVIMSVVCIGIHSVVVYTAIKTDLYSIKKNLKKNMLDASIVKAGFPSTVINIISMNTSKIVEIKKVPGKKIGKFKYARSYMVGNQNNVGKLIVAGNKKYFFPNDKD